MPDVGDLVTASLTVAPAGVTTGASLVVTRPDGSVVTPVVTGSDDGATWTAPVSYTLAGIWRLSWTVTGTGASVQHEVVSVAPAPAVMADVRSYATTTQLANFLHAAPPLDAVKLLERATDLLDSDFLGPAVYDVDDDGMPTDAEVIEAFAEAVCAQVEFWGEVGEETDISGPLQGVQLGSVALQFGAGDNRSGPDYYAPKLVRALQNLPGDKFRRVAYSGGC
ncbi:hypothetical protein PV735_05280 [Streptomyces turgidiscabies]|uniref:Uncharacterized protein n=1 Tax=Streptomyces turgidiscabies (strain Car8) TaxID=698760 RepID=L7EZ64_STRT8|nr:hypothetical protein [Streptomyces turgidiscabies]ELP64169.1 hypothetical protein STRTUCAR8_05590 [Streptomyces turgidiscabies Car8]MDX3492101.1 hypothetical protein [Streptomyces turgidiscabies]